VCYILRELPYVVSLGALDMVNFAGLDTVPEKFKDRQLHSHNPDVTLMRTTKEDGRAMGRWMADKLNSSKRPLTLVIPEKGVSMMDAEGQPFFDPEADKALIDELVNRIQQTSERRVVCLPNNINEPEFAQALADAYLELVKK